MNIILNKKKCIYCEIEKPLSNFSKHPTRYDGLDGRCKSCIKERTKVVNEIRKTAPPMTEACECCGKKIGDDINYKQENLFFLNSLKAKIIIIFYFLRFNNLC